MRKNWSRRRLLPVVALALVLLLSQLVCAAEFPRGLHLSWQNDPATTMTLMWRSAPGATGVVEYGKSPGELTQTVESTTHSYRYARTEVYWHTAEITDLEPNTTYYYRVETSEPWVSEEYAFKTGLPQGDTTPFKVGVISDSHGHGANLSKVFAMLKEEQVDFILGLGDFTDTGNQAEWEVWFAASEGWLSEMPFMAVHGNHEGNQNTYWEQFAFPGNERWFSIDYGTAHFVFLMAASEPLAIEQLPWIEEDLQQNTSIWTIAMGHIPVYSSGTNHGSSPYLIKHWADVFAAYGVDFYLSGHNHMYERSHPIKDNQLDDAGVIYMTMGPVGDKYYEAVDEWWTAKTAENVSMFMVLSFEETQIAGVAKTLDGALIDEFVLERDF